jgi:hypothetical protein
MREMYISQSYYFIVVVFMMEIMNFSKKIFLLFYNLVKITLTFRLSLEN